MSTYSLWLINASKGMQTQVTNIQSEAEVDVSYYTGETYRDDMDANFCQSPWSPSTDPTTSPKCPAAVSDTYQDALFNATAGTSGKATPPRFKQVKRTQVQYTCLADDLTTTYLCKFWIDEWIPSNTKALRF